MFHGFFFICFEDVYDFLMITKESDVFGGAIVTLDVRIRVVVQEFSDDVDFSGSRGHVQGGFSHLVDVVETGSVLDQELEGGFIATEGGLQQGCFLVGVSDIDIRSHLDEEIQQDRKIWRGRKPDKIM